MIDRYVEPYPPESWAPWCAQQIEDADFVLMVCTEVYYRRVMNKEKPGRGKGVLWEAPIIYQLLYEEGSVSKRFVPVLFGDGDPDHIPMPVRKFARFNVDNPTSYELLLRHLHDKPPTPPTRWSAATTVPSAGGSIRARHPRRAGDRVPATGAQPAASAGGGRFRRASGGAAGPFRLPAAGGSAAAAGGGLGDGRGRQVVSGRSLLHAARRHVSRRLDPPRGRSGDAGQRRRVADADRRPAEAAAGRRGGARRAAAGAADAAARGERGHGRAAAAVGALALRLRGCPLVASARISTARTAPPAGCTRCWPNSAAAGRTGTRQSHG